MKNNFVKLAEQIRAASKVQEAAKQIKIANFILAAKGLQVLKDQLGLK